MCNLLDPYVFHGGCERLAVYAENLHEWKDCKYGKTCVSADECSDCSFGECLQHSKAHHADGFSYSFSKVCRMCTIDQLSHLETKDNWKVYILKGNNNNFIIHCFRNTLNQVKRQWPKLKLFPPHLN